mgnify:CR=1 FL=1
MFLAASSRFSQKVFLRVISLGLSGTLARQHCVRCGHPPQSSHRYQAVDTNCPDCTSVVSRLRCSFLLCTQVKQSSSGVIFHVLNTAHLLAKLACLLLIIVIGLYEAYLAISHMIFLHPHEGCICVGLGVAVTPLAHDGKHFFVPFPPLQKRLFRLAPIPSESVLYASPCR